MERLYQEWTTDQDRELWEHRHKEPVMLASRMGRGIRGVQARLSKLRDVNSPAYQRLFGSNKGHRNQQDVDESSNDGRKSTHNKLVPVSEVLRRIEYDHSLDPADFFVLHYDRLDDTIVKSPLDAPNESISNKETSLIKALPEHRIVGVMYKERLVWDRSTKLDLVFGGADGGIAKIVATYHDWKTEQDQMAMYEEARKEHVSMRLSSMLGVELYGQLDRMTTDLQIGHDDPTVSTKKQVETYVDKCLRLFQRQRQIMGTTQPSNLIPQSDFLALEELSQFVACWTSTRRTLQELVLWEISLAMDKAEGKSVQSIQEKQSAAVQSVELMEEDLEETFVRGSGPGGQKINKTSNRVVLIHKPTRLRVECQDTRSLQQNRKIARKRMKDKLDEYLNGSQSKVQMKHDELARKRKQSKAKNRARQKKKQQEKLEKKRQQGEENELDSDDEDDDDDDDYHL
jgi:protein subunit release factor B/uncharacterized protein (UPF0248 family)